MFSVRPFASKISRFPNFRSFSDHCEVPTPKLLYVQHPWTWLKIKYQFATLKHRWDPDFRECDFKVGSKAAVSVMTNLVRSQDVEVMKPITTKNGFKQIAMDSMCSKQDPRLTLLNFRPDDVKFVVPMRVTFVETFGGFFCLRWLQQHDILTFPVVFQTTITASSTSTAPPFGTWTIWSLTIQLNVRPYSRWPKKWVQI
jgi:hypothetical protein